MKSFWKQSSAVRPDRRTLGRTLIVMLVCGVLAFAALAARLGIVQLRDHGTYEALAIEQQTKETRIPARRGTIYDRNGNVLAQSATAYSVYICPNEMRLYGEDAKKIAAFLARTLELDYDTVALKCADTSTWYRTVKTKIDTAAADTLRAFISENSLRSIHIEEDSKRYYPYGALACHVLGFTGADGGGLEGIEALCDDALSGTDGSISRLAAGNGTDMLLGSYETCTAGTPGSDVHLTLDTNIQYIAEKYLDQAIADYDVQNGGCCLVMNVNTGALLAVASRNQYDPNDYLSVSDEVRQRLEQIADEDAYNAALTEARLAQWRNKAISDTYEPGSVFKILTLAMGLESGAVSESDSFYCGGTTAVPGRGKPLRCWKSAGHGSQTLTQAVQHSCNVAFCHIGLAVGAERFYDFADAFGLFDKTGVDLPGEADSQWWSRDVFCSETNLSQLAAASFGQTFNVTPIQMAAAISSVVNGGHSVRPYVVEETVGADGAVTDRRPQDESRETVSAGTSAKVCSILEQVVGGEGGTGRNAYVAGYRIGGKTGTSEKVAQDAAGGAKEYIVSFCGVAPIDDPDILVLFLLDTPSASCGAYISGGVMAAPSVGGILSEVLPYLGYERRLTADEEAAENKTVPDFSGLSPEDAAKAAAEAGLRSEWIGAGTAVTAQLPAAGAEIAAGSKVLLYAGGSAQSGSVSVPDLRGLTAAEARETLAARDLYLDPSGAPADDANAVVTAQSAEPESAAACGAVIRAVLTDETDTGQEDTIFYD